MNLDIYTGALAGALLVAFGVWIGAHLQPRPVATERAPRARNAPPRERTREPREPWTQTVEPRGHNRRVQIPTMTHAREAMRRDVVSALTTSGFAKADAEAATDLCKYTECSTLEAWTRAALKQLAPKAVAS